MGGAYPIWRAEAHKQVHTTVATAGHQKHARMLDGPLGGLGPARPRTGQQLSLLVTEIGCRGLEWRRLFSLRNELRPTLTAASSYTAINDTYRGLPARNGLSNVGGSLQDCPLRQSRSDESGRHFATAIDMSVTRAVITRSESHSLKLAAPRCHHSQS